MVKEETLKYGLWVRQDNIVHRDSSEQAILNIKSVPTGKIPLASNKKHQLVMFNRVLF